MAKQTLNGKAFEYACLKAIREKMDSIKKPVSIDKTAAYDTAKSKFLELSGDEQKKYTDAANTAVKIIFPLEPKLKNGEGELLLAISKDAAAQGADGDVRDVLCVRMKGQKDEWQIGLSCKHNHEALKHPRITADMDFGKNWVGIPNSTAFISEISKTIDELVSWSKKDALWKDITSTEAEKQDRYYVPILTAYKNEIERMCKSYMDVPKKLLSYFFGSKDFYKVIMRESRKMTEVEAFNMNGTLGKKSGKEKPAVNIRELSMPERLIEASFKKGSKTTIMLFFDGGWTVSMRLHNKDKKVRPTSLAWDVQLVGLPTGTYVNTRSWDE